MSELACAKCVHGWCIQRREVVKCEARISTLEARIAELERERATAKLEGVELLWKRAHEEWQKTDRGDWIQEFQDAYEAARASACTCGGSGVVLVYGNEEPCAALAYLARHPTPDKETT